LLRKRFSFTNFYGIKCVCSVLLYKEDLPNLVVPPHLIHQTIQYPLSGNFNFGDRQELLIGRGEREIKSATLNESLHDMAQLPTLKCDSSSFVITGTTLDPRIIDLLHFQTLRHRNKNFVCYKYKAGGIVEKREFPRSFLGGSNEPSSYCWCDLPLILGFNCQSCFRKILETEEILKPLFEKNSFRIIVVNKRVYPVGQHITGFDALQITIPILNTSHPIGLLQLLQMEKIYQTETFVLTELHDETGKWDYKKKHFARGFQAEELETVYCWCNIPLSNNNECNKCRSEIETLAKCKNFLNCFHNSFKVKIVSVPKFPS